MSRLCSFAGVFFALACIEGCGAGSGDIHGKVYLGDKPLAMGSVTFFDVNNKSYHSQIGEDGSYSVKGVVAGPTSITVVSRDPSIKPVQKERKRPKNKEEAEKASQGEKKNPEKGPPDPRWFRIPGEYGDPSAPFLTFSVKTGDNEWDIKLSDPPKKG